VFLAILVPMLFWAGLRPLHILLLASPVISLFLHLFFRTRGESAFWVWIAFLTGMVVVTVVRRRHWIENIVLLAMNAGVHHLEAVVWGRLHDYQQRRIETFFYPDLDKLGQGYHVAQSKIAIGSGGLLGKGFMQGTQKELFLPARHTDFFLGLGEVRAHRRAADLALFSIRSCGITFAKRPQPRSRYRLAIVAHRPQPQNIGDGRPVAGIPLPPSSRAAARWR
jgi:hypothetical protein